ncbi:MAG: hypothetical protein QOK43_163 [Acidimicrobiaceae bacterium]|nr:hypothetical protein [Acidimicrobiaceae bacterium]
MASNPPPDLVLAPLSGKAKTVEELLTMFDLCLVVLDPFTDESAWLLETAGRILQTFEQADVRIGWLMAGATAAEARMFLGPWAERMMTFPDPDRIAVKALGLAHLPALVHIGIDGTVIGADEGWHPVAWRRITADLAKRMAWLPPAIPVPGDPGPFDGTPAVA